MGDIIVDGELIGPVVGPGGSTGPTGPIKYTIEYILENEYLKALTDSITPDNIILVLASVVGVGMLFFLAWLGIRKATRTFSAAVSTGKIKI